VSKDFDILVVGGGIAGLSAALTAARLGRRTLVLTGDVLGGQLLNIEKIDGYPGFPDGVPGYDLCPMAQEQAAAAGAEFAMAGATRLERSSDAWLVGTPSESYDARSVILATGTRLRDLGVPGESTLRGKGVSQCASCDAPLLRNRPVIVAGGGDSALQEALTLAEHCSAVTLVHHNPELDAQSAYLQLVEGHPKITSVAES
jgi:thioredoxin reductase (NADPH)